MVKSKLGTRNVAEVTKVNPTTVTKTKKSLGISGTMDEDEALQVAKKIGTTERIRKRNEKIVEGLQSNTRFESKVRRIDQQDTASTKPMLQDAKDRYVANEQIIERLQHEIEQHEVYAVDNSNGSISVIPQLNTIQSFIKINISLRTQIMQMEQTLEISENEAEDPFA